MGYGLVFGLALLVAQSASAQQSGGATLGVTFKAKSLLGAMITDVAADSAAARAGLQAGDRILAINKSTVHGYADVVSMIGGLTPNTNVQLVINRDGINGTVPVTLGGPGAFSSVSTPRVISASPYTPADINDQHGFGG
jgi:S1-C subfamily serine protease